MPISQVALSNTFNEFRSTFNDAANTVNSFTAGTGAISANTITLATLTSGRVPLVSTAGLIVDDSNLTYNTSTDVLTLGGATDASSTTTGTLIVTGGVGVAKKLYVGTDLNVTANTTLSGTTESTSTTTGALKTAGGLGVVKNVYVGGIVDVANTTQSTSVSSGALIVDGGAGIAKNLYVGGIVDVTDTTQSTSVTTGALIVDGGAGIAKNVYVGGDMQVTGNLTILGSNSSISTTQINIDDNMLQIANTNVANTVDIGFFGQYSTGSGNVHSGIFRDASDGIWKFFKDYNVEPSTTIDVSANGFSYANVTLGALSAANNISIGTGQAYQINGANVLSSTVLGSTVVASSLTSVGTITSGTWNGTTIAVSSGGTGVTTSTGSGNNVLSTSPTLVTPILGTPTSGTLSNCTVDGTNGVGYLNIPQNSQSAAYTTVLADAGKSIFHPSSDANARTFTIPANGTVAYPIGTVIQFVNMTSQVVTIAITTDTMYLGGTGTTGSRSLAQYGVANAMKITSTNWIITGSGLT